MGCASQPATCLVGTGSPLPGPKRRSAKLTATHIRLVPRLRMRGLFLHSSGVPSWRAEGQLCFVLQSMLGCIIGWWLRSVSVRILYGDLSTPSGKSMSRVVSVCVCVLACAPLLDAFAKLRKSTIRFVLSVCPSAWSNLAPTGRNFLKFFEYFSKMC
jgi:hypothetical protein